MSRVTYRGNIRMFKKKFGFLARLKRHPWLLEAQRIKNILNNKKFNPNSCMKRAPGVYKVPFRPFTSEEE